MDKDITGLMVYYYEVCKRKLWYFTNDIQLEENNSNVILGKLLEENTYTRDEKKINIDGVINIDFIIKIGYKIIFINLLYILWIYEYSRIW